MGAAFESVVTFLFKYPPRVFQRGDLALAPVVPALLIALVAAGSLALITVMYRRLRAVSSVDRVVLGTIRALSVLLVLACLMRPTVVLSSAVNQRNVLAILLDDSRSMRLRDVNGAQRLAAVQGVFADSSALMRRLGQRFALRTFRFAADAGPSAGVASLTGAGGRTDLAGALDVTRQDLTGMPLAGVVVVTDGADNGGGDLATTLLALRARRVPVYTVGVGQERFAHDVAVERVTVPPSVLAGSTTLIEAALAVRGTRGERTTVTVEANGRIVATEEVRLPDAGDGARVRLRVPPLAPGTYSLSIIARPLANEVVTENNAYHTILEVRPDPVRILYIEGEPRPEFAFLRRAVAADSSLDVVGLMRSADRKFLRLGVRDSLELVSGFPSKREELFKYRAVILGSIESSFFTGDQLRMLAEFVSQRGGTLLALGGRASLGEGGYSGTPMAEVLPVLLPSAGKDSTPAVALAIHPTASGLAHAALQLRETDAANSRRWDSLPVLTSVNKLGALRPGATVLLSGRPGGRESTAQEVPVLAYQRYGRGVGAVLNVQDTWLWRMDASMPVDDATHSTLWRQLLRWAAEGVPDQVEIAAVPARVAPGEPVSLRAHVTDSAFIDVNSASVLARVTSPSGRQLEVPLEWSLREDGSYTGRFIAEEAGVYRLSAEARRGRDTTRSAGGALLADDQGADVEQAELRTPLLRRIARETGGRYYPLAAAARIPEDAVYTEAGVTVRDPRDLWDMPAIFLILVSLMGAEWIYRRRRGLA
ncbi:glutamine amidotransferase [soil metagenome]